MYIIYLCFYGYKVHGWQIQAGSLETFQLILKEAFIKLFKTDDFTNPSGCSRTDADVHALEFISTVKAVVNIPCESLKKGLNTILPPNIRVIKVEKEETYRDARDLVFGKHYRYLIYRGENVSPFFNSLVWHSRYELDIEKMKECIPYLIGTNDFTAFSASDSCAKTKIRTIKDMRINQYGSFIAIDVTGDGFLKQMIRIIGGTLVEAGKNRLAPEQIPSIFESKDRTKAGATLPGKGLYLYKLFRKPEEIDAYKIPDFSPDEMFWSPENRFF